MILVRALVFGVAVIASVVLAISVGRLFESRFVTFATQFLSGGCIAIGVGMIAKKRNNHVPKLLTEKERKLLMLSGSLFFGAAFFLAVGSRIRAEGYFAASASAINLIAALRYFITARHKSEERRSA